MVSRSITDYEIYTDAANDRIIVAPGCRLVQGPGKLFPRGHGWVDRARLRDRTRRKTSSSAGLPVGGADDRRLYILSGARSLPGDGCKGTISIWGRHDDPLVIDQASRWLEIQERRASVCA